MFNLIFAICMNLVFLGLGFLFFYIQKNRKKVDKDKFIMLSKLFMFLIGLLALMVFAYLVVNILGVCGVWSI